MGRRNRVWHILKKDPTAFSNELEVHSERKRVKNNLVVFRLSTRKEEGKEGDSREAINQSHILISKVGSQISQTLMRGGSSSKK